MQSDLEKSFRQEREESNRERNFDDCKKRLDDAICEDLEKCIVDIEFKMDSVRYGKACQESFREHPEVAHAIEFAPDFWKDRINEHIRDICDELHDYDKDSLRHDAYSSFGLVDSVLVTKSKTKIELNLYWEGFDAGYERANSVIGGDGSAIGVPLVMIASFVFGAFMMFIISRTLI